MLLTIAFCILHNPDTDCNGLANMMTDTIFYALLVITITLALTGIFRKRQSNKFKAEPISALLLIISLLILVFYANLEGHTNGEKWLTAGYTQTGNSLSTQKLLLRKNGDFTISLYEADFGCDISGSFTKKGDTIYLDEASVAKTNPNISSVYLMQSNKLIPLLDTINKITFTIKELTR